MKRLTLSILIALIASVSISVAAQCSQKSCGAIPFEKLVDMIATDAHWDCDNLVEIGLSQLVSETEDDEECGAFYYFVYGRNVEAKLSEDWSVTLTSEGPHAYAIEVVLMTDNGTKLYFKEKADHDAFMSCARESSHYDSTDVSEWIGLSLIESDEFIDGWYVISFHGG
ncbi:MAG: hypothetical protein J6S96_09200 [Muribaculaceae bacterium]|nr:hypothetical protein [Muribaculaceae bacterium]